MDWVVIENIFVISVMSWMLGDLADRKFDLGCGHRLDQDLVDVGKADRLRVIGRLTGGTRGIQRRGAGIEAAQRVDRIAGGRGAGPGTGALIRVPQRRTTHAVLDGGPGRQHEVVLIHPHHVGTLAT